MLYSVSATSCSVICPYFSLCGLYILTICNNSECVCGSVWKISAGQPSCNINFLLLIVADFSNKTEWYLALSITMTDSVTKYSGICSRNHIYIIWWSFPHHRYCFLILTKKLIYFLELQFCQLFQHDIWAYHVCHWGLGYLTHHPSSSNFCECGFDSPTFHLNGIHICNIPCLISCTVLKNIALAVTISVCSISNFLPSLRGAYLKPVDFQILNIGTSLPLNRVTSFVSMSSFLAEGNCSLS